MKNPKEIGEKMKIVNFLHFLFTTVHNPTKKPITDDCDRVCIFGSYQMTRLAYSAAIPIVAATRQAANLNSGILPNGSTTGLVKIFAAAST